MCIRDSTKTDPNSTVYPLNIPKTCGGCHGDPAMAKKFHLPNVYALYIDSIHGFALGKEGLLVAANCTSCHGSDVYKRQPSTRAWLALCTWSTARDAATAVMLWL